MGYGGVTSSGDRGDFSHFCLLVARGSPQGHSCSNQRPESLLVNLVVPWKSISRLALPSIFPRQSPSSSILACTGREGAPPSCQLLFFSFVFMPIANDCV
jgi:hypothetical protein